MSVIVLCSALCSVVKGAVVMATRIGAPLKRKRDDSTVQTTTTQATSTQLSEHPWKRRIIAVTQQEYSPEHVRGTDKKS